MSWSTCLASAQVRKLDVWRHHHEIPRWFAMHFNHGCTCALYGADVANEAIDGRQQVSVALEGTGCIVSASVNALTAMVASNPGASLYLLDQDGLQVNICAHQMWHASATKRFS